MDFIEKLKKSILDDNQNQVQSDSIIFKNA